MIKNIKIKDSPVWLKEWLEANQVPVVNNLRLETGQNLQIYDYNKEKGGN
ncbi:MAG: hypothetical protein I3273_01780 [Candidatus Moeniiplasma glomeromycotorum]|nr:hypothetical protein [Candidatus Moeniiplasma glomeromycotorum]MCE8167149.1 hypothetical protein [Candidatus Moeniiplasma glomeromycotorum]MCE8168839.1 hypothetical protein [Candidatus Moeniiplasma glomeromycotorum]